VLLFALGLAVCIAGQFSRELGPAGSEQSDLLLFCGIALVVGVAGHFCFLKILSYATHPWYYLAPMAVVAMFLDLTFDAVQPTAWARAARLALALTIAVCSVPLTWAQVHTRQTNVDLIAAELGRVAHRDDLIVVNPWYNGISFERYYHGAAAWMTIPPMDFHKFHRFDLLLAPLALADQEEPIRPLLGKIHQTLQAGHRVWMVGSLGASKPVEPPLTLPLRKDTRRFELEAHSLAWSMKVVVQLRLWARQLHEVRVESNQPVNRLENLSLMVFDGWSGG
jgi:hypothetical protein